jgi:filamentous hemagglutinin
MFASPHQLLDHFNRHGADFGVLSASEYEREADGFLNGSLRTGVLQKNRVNGDIVRYDPSTEAFGVVKTDGTIRTYYKPDPAVHGHPTNLDYFNAQ